MCSDLNLCFEHETSYSHREQMFINIVDYSALLQQVIT